MSQTNWMSAALLVGIFSLPPQLSAAASLSEDAQTCLECHGQADFETERDGKPKSLHVDAAKFTRSVHAGLSCTSCHADLAGELPHAERAAPVACGTCHENRQKEFAASLHGKAFAKKDPLAPNCANCHGKHDILAIADRNSAVAPIRIPFVCGSCHQEGAAVSKQRDIHQHNILKNFSLSIHGEGLLSKGLSVSATCASCHTSHKILPHTDPASSIARHNIVKTCTKCHSQIEQVHRKIIRGELWETNPNVIPVCVDCHQPHKARKIFYEQGMADQDCLRCHKQPGLKRASDGKSMTVAAAQLGGSIHLKVSCAQCHMGVSPSKKRSCETVTKKVDCSVCHSSQVEQYKTSTHGTLRASGEKNAPHCTDCHGDHGILSRRDPASPTFPIKVPDLCAGCHREGEKAALRRGAGGQHAITENYTESIHGKGLLKSGLVVTAMCTSCHTAHGELPANDPASSINSAHIAKTCSQCHHGVYNKFSESIHAKSPEKDGIKTPVCSTCHTAHTIKRTDKDNFKLEIMTLCGNCHTEVAKTYFDTYHGKVSQLGYAKTAKCHDCHGAHEIFSIDDPRSKLSRKNIVETCKKCHPGAQKKFAGYLTHSTHHDPKKYPLVFWTFWAMTSLLVGTFLVFGIHTLLWLPRSLAMRRLHPPEKYDAERKQYRRFSALQSVQHVVMILSFMTLAATGMTLKFSYTAWARILSHVLGGFEVTGFLHRVAAVIMIILFLSHLWDLTQNYRKEPGGWKAFLFGPNSMLPSLRDAFEIVGTLKWYLGMGKQPNYGRWTYWEKFDYFAVFWGITIIGSSGMALWFPEIITRILPGWIINVATIIHSDEALLASGFIFTIHFFNTHFRPEKFPMDVVVFTGRLSLEEFKRERPDEYAALEKSGTLEDHIVAPLPLWAIRWIRVFAWSALAVGSALIVGIIYAMLFAYR